jgi:DNA-binding transcriptional ArsR family regulator
VTDRLINPVFRALADPTRRGIVSLLRRGGLPVGDVAGRFAMSRPAVSRHLKVLREARLVVERREGRRRVCELNPEPLRHLDEWIAIYRPLWNERLGRLKALVETPSPLPKPDRKR